MNILIFTLNITYLISMQSCGHSLPCTCWGGPMNLKIFLNFLASPPASVAHYYALSGGWVNPEGVLCAPGGDLSAFLLPLPHPRLWWPLPHTVRFLHTQDGRDALRLPSSMVLGTVTFHPEKSQPASGGLLSILLPTTLHSFPAAHN